MLYIGSDKDLSQIPTIIYMGIADATNSVSKIYVGDEDNKAVLVWEFSSAT